jgi:pimeloyl-ACP methyl ester carboxylesterase
VNRFRPCLALLAFAVCCNIFGVISGEKAAYGQQSPSPEMLRQLEQIERSFLYFPRKYGEETVAEFAEGGGVRIDYRTEQGAQTAWWVPQQKGESPERVWIFCGGNGTLALDFDPLVRALPLPSDAYLLVDYPGYGECEGSPSPGAIRENVKRSLQAAEKATGLDVTTEPSKLRAFGHSLGAAAALMAVEEWNIPGVVCYAPFTSTPDMARTRFLVSKDIPIQHVFDNRVGLKALAANKGRAWILHGDADNVIPVQMSRTLAEEFQEAVDLTVIAGGDHGNLFALHQDLFLKALTAARK